MRWIDADSTPEWWAQIIKVKGGLNCLLREPGVNNAVGCGQKSKFRPLVSTNHRCDSEMKPGAVHRFPAVYLTIKENL